MGQVFTISLQGAKFHYQLLKLNQKNRMVESEILLQGNTVTLYKDDRGWKQKENALPLVDELVRAIGNSLSLRYRI
ncbi:hypothetical protein [Desertivirga arenae]|uniref:hypothetical protein n=1 Tax=Desertivirga arenae TaxID=2810309 RepID=UPI001A96149E|nr:hypothetical protein [Pedobacter sp. SYSU D00823]